MHRAGPIVVCVGMGMAVIASLSLSVRKRNIWHTIQSKLARQRRQSHTRRMHSLSAKMSECASLPSQNPAKNDSQRSIAHTYRPSFISCVCDRAQIDSTELSRKKITIVQFNILARNLASQTHFPYVIESRLTWDNRKQILLRQLEGLDADILCLEELSDYWTFFKSELGERGYDSVYVKRPSIHVSNWSGEKKQDGCGIFFKKDKFELKECESINFHDTHDRVAILALLQSKQFAQLFLVGCTHLWWNSKKVDHQMAELYEFEEEVIRLCSDMKDKYQQEIRSSITGGPNFPVILCGDFNNTPQSAIYDHMHNSFLQRPNMEGIREEFRSAYRYYRLNEMAQSSSVSSMKEEIVGEFEPPHTTVNYRRCWTIDYIWYSSSNLVPCRILEIPSEAVLRAEEGPPGWFERLAHLDTFQKSGRKQGSQNGIPNSKCGSDHIPLFAELEFTKRSKM
uniref:Uncharacterized protein AlNc14C94G5805 n=1 Tax=Albugo laibachii Nc14 TaxID=890382 RepID=F0WGS8_9STRA|nr:conserved hypothetical protein [Albugo laibachii Nc14]|eukprot:CCA20442.1 conserved hypothetical protein [Albugo laibachii Nc14]